MKAADFFAAVDSLPVGSIGDLTKGGGIVVVAPHPDDESLGCGGLIAEACATGVAVRLIVVSDGTGSHPSSPRYPAARLRELREAETRAAAQELGLDPEAICFLRLPDRRVPTEGPDAEAARDAIADAAAAMGADAVFVTWAHDPHCDHAASAELVAAAAPRLAGARVFHYPIWGRTLARETDVGGPPRGVRLDVARHIEAKTAAVAAHRSQTTNLIDDDPSGFRLTPGVVSQLTGPFELFIEAGTMREP